MFAGFIVVWRLQRFFEYSSLKITRLASFLQNRKKRTLIRNRYYTASGTGHNEKTHYEA